MYNLQKTPTMIFLDKFTSPEALTLKHEAPPESYHIFLRLFQKAKEQIGVTAYMDLYYFYTLCEKCLSFSRRREFKSTAVVFEQLKAIDRSTFPDTLKPGAEANYYACEAYIDYASGHYAAAAEKMNKAVSLSIEQSALDAAFLPSIYELQINLMRISFKIKDAERAIATAATILRSLFFNGVPAQSCFVPGLAAMDEAERKRWAHYLLDNFIYGLLVTLKAEKDTAGALLRQLLERSLDQGNSQDVFLEPIQETLQMVLAGIRGDEALLGQLWVEQFDAIAHAPHFIKKIILQQFMDRAQSNEQELFAHPNYDHFVKVLASFDIKAPESPVRLEAA